MLLLSLAGFFLTGVMVMYSHRARRNADFLISSILAGLFFFTQIQPYILSSDHLFVFISYIVVFVGAAVGGILGKLPLFRFLLIIHLFIYLILKQVKPSSP